MLAELDLKVAPSQFAPLLEREEEKKMFRIAMEFGKVKLSDQFRSSPQTLLSGCLKGSFIPSRFLPAVCALDRDGGTSLTPLGKIVQRLARQLKGEGIEAFFVLTSGAAKETAAGAKPYAKTRTLKNGSLRMQDYDLNFGRPRMDGDILVISPDLSGEMIKELPEKLPTYEGLEIKFRESRSRPISMIKVNGVIRKTFLTGIGGSVDFRLGKFLLLSLERKTIFKFLLLLMFLARTQTRVSFY